MPMLQLRNLTVEDVAEIGRWPPYPSEFVELDYALRQNGWLDDFGFRPDAWCFAVENAGELIAFTIVSGTGRAEAEFRLALRGDRIGMGLGAEIIPLTLKKASDLGFTRIHLLVRKNNPRARRLYRRMGFAKRGECSRSINGLQVLFDRMDIFIQREETMKRALLVIDVQNEYFSGKLPVSYPSGSIENIIKVMESAAASNTSVVVIRHAAKAADAPVFQKGTPEWELHPEIEKRRRDVLIEKNWPDSFTETGLEEWLRNKGIDTLTVCGYMTHMCCDTTARRAYHLRFSVEFLADATGTLALSSEFGSVTAEELHRAILVTQNRFCKVMTTDQWINLVKDR